MKVLKAILRMLGKRLSNLYDKILEANHVASLHERRLEEAKDRARRHSMHFPRGGL